MKKNKKKSRKNYYLIIIVFFLICSYYEINGNYRIGGIMRDIIYSPYRKDYYNDLYTLINNEVKNENNELKGLLNIDYSFTEFEPVNATIIERNSTYWLDELTINKGSNDFILKNQIVITRNGMIGKVINVSNKTAKVKLITGLQEPTLVEVNGIPKVLFNNNYELYIKGINNKDNINIGDKITTLGFSKNYPKGILIGEILELNPSSDGVGKTAKIKLSQDLNNIRFVSVLKGKNI